MVLEVKKPRAMWEILFSTHHTDIGLLYIITSISFLFMGGVLALSIRSELFLPAAHFLGMGANDFERIFTVHGTDMLLLWVIPFGAGVGNYLIPIYVRYKDMVWGVLPSLSAFIFMLSYP
jgi:cytochrome c oxidase subunit I